MMSQRKGGERSVAVRALGMLFSLFFSGACGLLGLRTSELYTNWLTSYGIKGGPRLAFSYEVAFVVLGLLVGFVLASVIFRQLIELGGNLQRIPPAERISGFVGFIIGLALIALFRIVLDPLPYRNWFLVLLTVPSVYLGMVLAISIKEELYYFFPGLAATKMDMPNEMRPGAHPKLLDTNVIIDGRIADICKSGFLEGPVFVPGFVLEELRIIADSADSLKRNRGRRGLDILNQMQKELQMMVQVYDRYNIPLSDAEGVDVKLVKLAQDLNAFIITNDFNLNKVAQLQGVTVLNVNELANAVKPVVLPGEEMTVTIVKEGKEPQQGVAYLEDGTMVVVENGKRFIGSTVSVVVTSVLQTIAGKMIFANLRNNGGQEEADPGTHLRPYPGGRNRKKARLGG